MKKLIITAIIAAINLCAFAQVDPALLSMKNRQIGNTPTPVTHTKQQVPTAAPPTPTYKAPVKQRVPTQHMVTSAEIQADTNGKVPDWQAVFVKDRKDKEAMLKNGFYLEATMTKTAKPQNGITSPLVTLKEDYHNEGFKEAPAPVFDETKPITVQFSQDGKLIPIQSVPKQVKKAIIDTVLPTDFTGMKMSVRMENGKFVSNNEPQMPASVAEIVENIRKMDDDVSEEQFMLNNKSFMLKNRSESEDDNDEIISIERDKQLDYKRPIAKKVSVNKVRPVIQKTKIVDNWEYIERYWDIAHDGDDDGVPYWLTLAQGILEGTGGRSWLAFNANNNFGVKCAGGNCKNTDITHIHVWVYDDFKKGPNKHKESFRAYTTVEQSFIDHIQFFKDSPKRYGQFLSVANSDISMKLYLIWRSGYATDPFYDYKLAKLIEFYGLFVDKNDNPIAFHYDRQKTAKRYKEMFK